MGNTYYLNPLTGSDADTGADWDHAWQTITSGPTSARIAVGDTIKIAKSPDPTSLGITGLWTNGPVPSAKSIGSSTNATPIVVTINSHGYATGDIVFINGHSTNTNANGVWIITKVNDNSFSLDGSVGNGIGGATGTCTLWNAKCIKLGSSLTQTIDKCDVAWTAATANYTVTLDTTVFKTGYGSMKCVAAAGAGVEKCAYYALPSTLDLSGYQQVSFWVRCTVALSANDFTLRLCSDASGDTVVNTINIPAVSAVGAIGGWHVFTVDNGGALGSSIASVSLAQAVDKGALTIWIDKMVAVKDDTSDDSLSLTSLISKNSAGQGGNEAWYGIQDIEGTIVALDQYPDLAPNATGNRGYTGTTETVTCYKRETFKLKTAGINDNAAAPQKAGSIGNIIEYQGGYNTSSGNQDGETFWDGINGYGYGLSSTVNYIKTNHCNFVRYRRGLYFSALGNEFIGIQSISNCMSGGVELGAPYGCIVNATNLNNNTNGISNGTSSPGAFCNQFTVTNINNSLSAGVAGYRGHSENIYYLGNVKNNGGYGADFDYYCSRNRIYNMTTANNVSGGIRSVSEWNYLFNCTIGESTEAVLSTTDARIWSSKHDNTAGNHWVFFDFGTVNLQTSIVHGTSAWKFITNGASRSSYYPLWIPLIRLRVIASTTYTISAWVKKDHATQVGAKLICRGGQIAGVASDVSDTKADDTDWEQLQIEITPTENGVVEIEGQVWYATANNNAYFDADLSVGTA